MKKILMLCYLALSIAQAEPISPIPLHTNVNMQKAQLGKELFFDTSLSKDNSTSCFSCHNVYNGGADTRVVSQGFKGRKGNIQSPTVLNAKFNFRQFWNGRASSLAEQINGPVNNPVEMNMGSKAIEKYINNSKYYKKQFQKIYKVKKISYKLVVNAIVEFENALTTPNSKFDRYLRHKTTLSIKEREGYALFKELGCITCHNGVNIGSNSFQRMGTFIPYKNKKKYPDRYAVSKDKNDINVFKVPTLRNIALTAPYFHDGSAKTLHDAIKEMAHYNLGIELKNSDIQKIEAFLKTLNGKTPKILDTK